MRANPRFLVVTAVLAIGALALLGWQRRTADKLRHEIARARARTAEQARQQAAQQQQRLIEAQTNTAELERLLAERTAVAQLRTELAAMRRRAAEAAAVRRASDGAVTEAPPSLVQQRLSFDRWRNAGQASSEAAFETALWAAAGGDVDALVSLLAFDPAAQSRAAALFAQLSPAIQQELATPERLVAILTAKDVPLGHAEILSQNPTPTETKVAVRISDSEGKGKVSVFSLRAENDRWRLVVPEPVVQRYAAWLQAPAGAAK